MIRKSTFILLVIFLILAGFAFALQLGWFEKDIVEPTPALQPSLLDGFPVENLAVSPGVRKRALPRLRFPGSQTVHGQSLNPEVFTVILGRSSNYFPPFMAFHQRHWLQPIHHWNHWEFHQIP